MLNYYFGGSLERVSGHVSCKHELNVTDRFTGLIATPVNSFHDFAIPEKGLGKDLEPIAFDASGYIEAFVHISLKVSGIMWHPERESPHRSADLKLLEGFLE